MKHYSYYEIICDNIICGEIVIGVCCVEKGKADDDTLLHIATEDRVSVFGEITKEEFDKYGDAWWKKPISTIRWKPVIKRIIELQPIEV